MIKVLLLVLYLLIGLYIFFKAIVAVGGIVGYRNIVDSCNPDANFTLVMIIAFCYTVFLWPVCIFNLIRNSEE